MRRTLCLCAWTGCECAAVHDCDLTWMSTQAVPHLWNPWDSTHYMSRDFTLLETVIPFDTKIQPLCLKTQPSVLERLLPPLTTSSICCSQWAQSWELCSQLQAVLCGSDLFPLLHWKVGLLNLWRHYPTFLMCLQPDLILTAEILLQLEPYLRKDWQVWIHCLTANFIEIIRP